ncbi:lysozyme inhibitor LprI family protein [Pseudomonas putida]|uniref:lysozyme inhibitor LprI family protein n=1 Tax=Pseudomonas putida TaxID=303 RepID=UPI00370BBD27
MSLPRSLLLLTALALPALPVQAKEPQYSVTYDRCIDTSGGVTAEMLDCNAAELKRHDARLNAQYKAALAAHGETQQALLREAQRQWIQYRDANCGFYAQLTGGTMDRLNSSSCVLEATARRADELEGIVGI